MDAPDLFRRQRYRLNGEPVFDNTFGQWTVEDLYPEVTYYELDLAGFQEIPLDSEVEDWLVFLTSHNAPLLFLIEQACHDGELLDRQLRATRLAKFPLAWIGACEEAIAAVPKDCADELFFMVYWSVRIERARRRGHP
jgi:hypothetical protein